MASGAMNGVTENDVLCGRGGATNGNEGNIRFRRLVAEHQQEYLQARKLEKAAIAQRIVEIIRGKGGRFLKQDGSGSWVDVGTQKSRQKTSQALREGLDVRKHEAIARKSAASLSESTAKKRQVGQNTTSAIDSTQFEDADGEETFDFALPYLSEETTSHRTGKVQSDPSSILSGKNYSLLQAL